MTHLCSRDRAPATAWQSGTLASSWFSVIVCKNLVPALAEDVAFRSSIPRHNLVEAFARPGIRVSSVQIAWVQQKYSMIVFHVLQMQVLMGLASSRVHATLAAAGEDLQPYLCMEVGHLRWLKDIQPKMLPYNDMCIVSGHSHVFLPQNLGLWELLCGWEPIRNS